MSTAEVTCTRCGAGAKFTGPTSFADMVLWDKQHREHCGCDASGVTPLPDHRPVMATGPAKTVRRVCERDRQPWPCVAAMAGGPLTGGSTETADREPADPAPEQPADSDAESRDLGESS